MNNEPLTLPEGVEINIDFDSLSEEQKAEILEVIKKQRVAYLNAKGQYHA